jgi:hypothetical protein
MNSRFKREMGDPPTKDVPSAHQNSLAIGYPLTKFQSTNLLDLSISKHNIYQVRDLVNIHHLGASSIIYCKNTRICQTHQSAHPISLSEHSSAHPNFSHIPYNQHPSPSLRSQGQKALQDASFSPGIHFLR